MTAPADAAALEARIEAVLAEHFVMWHDLPQQPIRGEWRCVCGLKFGFSDTAIAHVAAVLAPLVAGAAVPASDGLAARVEALAEEWGHEAASSVTSGEHGRARIFRRHSLALRRLLATHGAADGATGQEGT